jgi:hypothetical protein
LNFIIKYIYDFFHESRVNKKREEIILYDPHNTLFTWIIFSFPFLFFFRLCFSSIFFKFQFHLVILYLFGIELHIFFNLLFMRLCQSHDPDHEFDSVYSSFSLLFFIFFYQFYPSILSWFRIRLLDLFWFEFNDIILISWLGSRVWWVNLSWLELFFCIFF